MQLFSGGLISKQVNDSLITSQRKLKFIPCRGIGEIQVFQVLKMIIEFFMVFFFRNIICNQNTQASRYDANLQYIYVHCKCTVVDDSKTP